MSILQITAAIPGKGRVKLLASPTLEEAEKQMDGTGSDADGGASLAMGGAIEAPWAGKLFGAATPDGLTARWDNKVLRIRRDQPQTGSASATGGLLLDRRGTAVKSNVMPDGGEAEAVYDAGDFDGAWPSKMRVKSTVQLSGRAMTMKIVATNTGDAPEPVGLGWCPRFAVLSHDRGSLRLRLPSVTEEEIRDQRSGVPTGRLVSVEGTRKDFSAIEGRQLGNDSLEGTFVNLRQAALDSGPVTELWDPENRYGLRITMLSASIKAVHVSAPADAGFVTLAPQFNYDDPFGSEWPKDEKAGMVTIQPGGSIQWSIRLEIYGPPTPPGVR
jgi:galactose mutarotase-like enzyme